MDVMAEGIKLEYFAQITVKMLEDFRDTYKGKRVVLKDDIYNNNYTFEGCFLSGTGALMIMYHDNNFRSSHQSPLSNISYIGD